MDGKKLSLKIMDSGIENGDYFFVPYLFEKEIARYDKGAKADIRSLGELMASSRRRFE